jgi:hypothetical protein
MARKKPPTEVLGVFANDWSQEDRSWFLRQLLGKLNDSEKTSLLIELSRAVQDGLSVAFLHGEPLKRYLFVKSLNCGCEHFYEWLLSIDEQQHLQEQDKARKERIKKWKERQNHKLKIAERLLGAYKKAYLKCKEERAQRGGDLLEFLRPLVAAGEKWPEIAKTVLANEGKTDPSQEDVDRKADALRKWFKRHKPNDHK